MSWISILRQVYDINILSCQLTFIVWLYFRLEGEMCITSLIYNIYELYIKMSPVGYTQGRTVEPFTSS